MWRKRLLLCVCLTNSGRIAQEKIRAKLPEIDSKRPESLVSEYRLSMHQVCAHCTWARDHSTATDWSYRPTDRRTVYASRRAVDASGHVPDNCNVVCPAPACPFGFIQLEHSLTERGRGREMRTSGDSNCFERLPDSKCQMKIRVIIVSADPFPDYWP